MLRNKEEIRIAFFGTPAFAATILEALLNEKYHVVCVVCQPDKKIGRKQELQSPPVKQLAQQFQIPVLQPLKLKEDFSSVLSYQPNLILTCAYGQIVPATVLQAPKYGCLNVHPSALPKYRGGAPIQRAIMNGETSTDICLMEMAEAMDAGKVYMRKTITIGKDETCQELFTRLATISAELVVTSLPKYLCGGLAGQVQDEAKVTFAKNITKEEEKVLFHEEEIHALYNHIRALTKTPGAYGVVNGKRYKFLKTRMEETASNGLPGEVLGFEEGAIEIACTGGILKVYEIQAEGKKAMDAKSFANGHLKDIWHLQFE